LIAAPVEGEEMIAGLERDSEEARIASLTTAEENSASLRC
jgi:hypothetical protein